MLVCCELVFDGGWLVWVFGVAGALAVCVNALRSCGLTCRSVAVVIPFGFSWFDSVALIVFVWVFSVGFD